MKSTTSCRAGIAAISVYQPPWVLGNSWFGESMPRKFVHHTGIEARPISGENEVMLAVRAVRGLQAEVGCDLRDCAALVFVSPSFIPLAAAKQFLSEERARQERLRQAARQVVRRLGVPGCRAAGINWFCSGYSRAMDLVTRRLLPRLNFSTDQFVLVVTASRISRITDYGCKQTGALFGDLATATLVSPLGSTRHPPQFELLHAHAGKQKVDGVYFDFHRRDHVLVPAKDGGRMFDQERVVFSLDGMGIADIAPRAMAGALAESLAAIGTQPTDVRFVLPHQAGAGIVRLTAMKVEQLGVGGEVINGLTKGVGNVSSGSIPYGLKQHWSKLTGLIGCPTAAVGSPGRAEVSQGCILLRATPLHDRLARTAA
jgi:3-oxoacyl-[acyl-carrier-protein] synthase III